MRSAAVVAVLAACACAKPKPNLGPSADAIADGLVRQGCYDCLLEARKQYQQLDRGSAATAQRLFEIDLLLALREKELSLDSSASLARATALASRIPVPARGIVALVALVPPDAAGGRPLPLLPQARKDLEDAVATIDVAPLAQTVKTYLRLSIACGRLPVNPPPATETPDDAPLLIYRRAICDNPIKVEPLRLLRMAVPGFVETSFFLGRAAMASIFRTDGSAARQLFEEAHARFADSPSIAFGLATVYQATNDCRRAETMFSRVLELDSGHEDARLGRVVCRTYLSKNDEAIADATVLIEGSASNRGDAFYWRAWNQRRRARLELARADIEGARALRYNARVLTLAGMIEYDQKEFDSARRDLQQARELDARECEAPWYLALVEFSVEAWSPSATGFAAAADCYQSLITDTERQRADMAARTDVTEEFRARQIAGFDAAIAEDSVQRSAAELNAAINYGRAGDIPKATIYMKRAAVDPQRRLAVEDLRQVLGVPRW